MSNNKTSGGWTKVGSLRKGDTGSLYIKIDDNVTLSKGDTLSLQDPRKKFDRMVAAGKMSAEEAAEKAANVKDYIRYEVFKVPPKS
jgi:hypothetical protein